MEFQDAAALSATLKNIRISAGGVELDTPSVAELAKKWLSGHDLELTFTVSAIAVNQVRIETRAVWTDNISFARCSGRFEFLQSWNRTPNGWKLAAIELVSAVRFAPQAPGSKLGRKPRTSGRVVVFTLATRPDPCLDDLEESCRRQGIPLEIIGKGAPWNGFSYCKIRLLYWYLESHGEDIDIALFTDGYDTIFAEGLEPILTKFRRIGSPILFSAEANCYPGGPGLNEADYPPAPTRYRFLNSGGWIAELPVMLALLRRAGAARVRPNRCDQAGWTRAYLAGNSGIQLDHHCEIFQCLFLSTQDLKRKGRRPRNTATGTLPSVIHANGCISLVPWSDHLLGRYFRRKLARAAAAVFDFYKCHSPLLRLIRNLRQRAALKAS